MKAVEAEHLVKKYKEHVAVNDISFAVEKGSLFAYLGENGAGKSTTIHMLCTILEKTSGTVRICSHVLGEEDNEIRKDIGIVFQNSVLDHKLSVKQNLMTRGAYYGLSGKEIRARMAEFEDYFEIKEILNRPYGILSGGQRRRVDIMRALIHSPEILFLDEPTTGLDPKARKQVWEYIRFLQKEKRMTIFLTTHYMEETKEANQVVIMDRGKIICSGTPANLKRDYASDRLIWYAEETGDNNALVALLGKFVYDADHYTVNAPRDITEFLYRNRDRITEYEVIKGSMDDVFLKLTGREMAK